MEVKTIAVIGAGTIGRGIAFASASAGYHPMGPLELGDLVGLDVCLNVLEYLYQTLGEKYRPNPLLQRYVKQGRLGRKSGRGVYDYPGQECSGAS